jgi:membrane associated rhomboid family serine protease
MGIYERDYYRTQQRGGGLGEIRMWSITTWLLVINIVVFVIDGFWARTLQERAYERGLEIPTVLYPLHEWGAFTIKDGILRGQIWRAITCQFLHAGLWHILANMIGLWLFGPVVEMNLGKRRYLFFYLLCGIAGPVMYTGLWGLGFLTPLGPDMVRVQTQTQLLGASAGIFGVMLAAAYLAPDRMIFAYFFELPLRYFAWIMMGIAAYTVLVHGNNAGGQAAHLGGGLLGWILIRNEPLLDLVSRKKIVRGRKVKDWSRDMNR